MMAGPPESMIAELHDTHAEIARLKDEVARLEAEIEIVRDNGNWFADAAERLARWRDLCLDRMAAQHRINDALRDGLIKMSDERDEAYTCARMAEERVARLVEGAKDKDAKLARLMALCDQFSDEDDNMTFREWKREYLIIRHDLLARAHGEVDNG